MGLPWPPGNCGRRRSCPVPRGALPGLDILLTALEGRTTAFELFKPLSNPFKLLFKALEFVKLLEFELDKFTELGPPTLEIGPPRVGGFESGAARDGGRDKIISDISKSSFCRSGIGSGFCCDLGRLLAPKRAKKGFVIRLFGVAFLPILCGVTGRFLGISLVGGGGASKEGGGGGSGGGVVGDGLRSSRTTVLFFENRFGEIGSNLCDSIRKYVNDKLPFLKLKRKK